MKDCFLTDTFIKDSTTKKMTVNLNVIMPFLVCLLLNKMLFLSRVHLPLTHNRATLITEVYSGSSAHFAAALGICEVSAMGQEKLRFSKEV